MPRLQKHQAKPGEYVWVVGVVVGIAIGHSAIELYQL